MKKLNGKSKDITADNIEQLKQLFPEAFTEGKVDFDVLKEVLGAFVDDRDERYRFTWNGKSKARLIAQTPSTGTLRPCKEESVDWDSTQNIFIEGDNLEVLKLLQKSYHKKVKMIYIDPPYNTGKDFVYKDNFKDNIKNYKEITGQVDGEGRNLSNNPETSGRYHTDWLNMMYPRLKLARNLLKDDGVIFIQIDDNEFFNLQNICNEIFGEENFIASLCVQMSYVSGEKMAHIDKKPPKIKEFVLLYAKNKSEIVLNPQYKPREISTEYNKFLIKNNSNDHQDWNVVALSSHLKKLEISSKSEIENFMFENADLIFNRVRSKNEEFLETRNIEYPVKITTKTGLKKLAWRGRECIFLSSKVGKDENREDVYLEALGDIWNDINITNIYQEGNIGFKNGKKPLKLIKRLVDYIATGNDICLDFFAGSATTAHSIFELNLEKRQNLKFIMVQLPELIDKKNKEQKDSFDFCINNNLQPLVSEISKERIRRAADKIKQENPDYSGDLGFRVFKLDYTNIKPWEMDFDMSEQDLLNQVENIKPDRREEDVLYEILIKYGLDLTLPITERAVAGQKVFDIGMGALIICLADTISLEVVKGIAQLKDALNPEIMRVVFKDSGFKDDVVKTNAVQMLKQAGIDDVRSL